MVSLASGGGLTMAKLRRKKAAYTRRTRSRMRIQRDALNLEYLRTVRDIAKAEMAKNGEPSTPLSVYSIEPFPLAYQFREEVLPHGITKYSYNRLPMPKWKDVTVKFKIDVFQLLCEEWNKSLYSFNPVIHPALLKSLGYTSIVKSLQKRFKRRLDAIGELPRHHFFVVESHDKRGKPVKPHIHGMAMVEDDKQAQRVKLAVGKAAGQDILGRGKLPRGNSGKFCYYKEGKSWTSYITKNLSRDAKVFDRRPFVFSRKANRLAKEFYEFITGQGE